MPLSITPGPLKVIECDTEPGTYVVTDALGITRAEVYDLANARAIAALPELIAVAERAAKVGVKGAADALRKAGAP